MGRFGGDVIDRERLGRHQVADQLLGVGHPEDLVALGLDVVSEVMEGRGRDRLASLLSLELPKLVDRGKELVGAICEIVRSG